MIPAPVNNTTLPPATGYIYIYIYIYKCHFLYSMMPSTNITEDDDDDDDDDNNGLLRAVIIES
jgi:hypothetical protein